MNKRVYRIITGITLLLCLTLIAKAEDLVQPFSLPQVIAYGLAHNPRLQASEKGIVIESYAVATSRSNRMPKLDFNSWTYQFRYDTPISSINPQELFKGDLSGFDDTQLGAGINLTIPLYTGGRLERAVKISELKQAIARDDYQFNRKELIFNLSSLYYKIAQMQKLMESTDAGVQQLEAHHKDVELLLQSGSVPRTELLKTDVELAQRKQERLLVINNQESLYAMLQTWMGMESITTSFRIIMDTRETMTVPVESVLLPEALKNRPDYQALKKRERIEQELIHIASGRKQPSLFLSSEYDFKSGGNWDFKEDWNIILKLNLPLFDAGNIKSSILLYRQELEQVKLQAKSLQLEIARQLKDAYLNLDNARQRMDVSQKAIESAREDLRVERLKYSTGAGTSTAVIDSQTALLRTQTNYYQAMYDEQIALVTLRKVAGMEYAPQEETK